MRASSPAKSVILSFMIQCEQIAGSKFKLCTERPDVRFEHRIQQMRYGLDMANKFELCLVSL